MLIDIGVSANRYFIFTKPNNSLAYIFDVFACRGNDKISCLCLAKFLSELLADKRLCFSGKSSIIGVYLPIVDTANTTYALPG